MYMWPLENNITNYEKVNSKCNQIYVKWPANQAHFKFLLAEIEWRQLPFRSYECGSNYANVYLEVSETTGNQKEANVSCFSEAQVLEIDPIFTN